MSEEPRIESLLEYHVLLALGDGPLYGYAICQAVEAESGGSVAPRAGSLYRIIARLMDRGMVEETGAPTGADEPHPGHARKYYALTASGSEVLHREARRLLKSAALAHRRLGLEVPEP